MKVIVGTIAVFETVPRSLTVDVPEGTAFRELIDILTKDYPEVSAVMLENGDIHSQIVVLLNGISILHKNGLDTMLKEGDDIYIVPIIHGG